MASGVIMVSLLHVLVPAEEELDIANELVPIHLRLAEVFHVLAQQ